MRKVLIAAAMLATTGLGGAASAQQAPHGNFNQGGQAGMQGRAPRVQQGRWGQSVGGHWYAGVQAPGGWRAYHRPSRGWSLPRYWISPDYYISDFASYGLSQPPYGYSWSRYYDDAVMVDARGQVWDSVSGLNWDGGYDQDYAEQVDYGPQGYPQQAYAPQGYAPQGYAQVPIQGQGGYYPPQRSNNGLGGAVAGAVVGGVAGNLIGGHGNRLGGTLIGAGVGALAGQAIDKSSHRGQGYGAGYPAPPPQGYPQGYGYPQSGVVYAPPQEIVQPAYASSSYSTGYVSSGSSTVVVQGPPVITETTTTTYIEEQAPVTYRRAVIRKPVKRWHPVRRQCTCTCGC